MKTIKITWLLLACMLLACVASNLTEIDPFNARWCLAIATIGCLGAIASVFDNQ